MILEIKAETFKNICKFIKNYDDKPCILANVLL